MRRSRRWRRGTVGPDRTAEPEVRPDATEDVCGGDETVVTVLDGLTGYMACAVWVGSLPFQSHTRFTSTRQPM